MDSPDSPTPNPSVYSYFPQSSDYPGYYQPNVYPNYTPPQSGPIPWTRPMYPISTGSQTSYPQPALQFQNTFGPPVTPARQPLTSSQPRQPLPRTTAAPSRKRAPQNNASGLGARANKRARRSDLENHPPALPSELEHSASQQSVPLVSSTGLFQPPTISAAPQHPVFTAFTSILPKDKKSTKAATDVWFFMRRSDTREKPEILPPLRDEDMLYERPSDGAFLACRLCTGHDWRAWKNVNGQTEKIRKHLHESHWLLYREFVLQFHLKGWEAIARGEVPTCAGGASQTGTDREPFSREGFYKRLAEWIVVDDQAPNVTDCKELRELLLFISPQLKDSDIPHRTTITKVIIENFQKEYEKLKSEIQLSEGRISYTSDVWSRTDLSAFMAVTAHYLVTVKGQLTLRNQLVAFRHLQGSHTGENLADVFFRVLEELDVLDQMGMVTLDNASNNNTLMTNLKRRFQEKGIPFDEHQNRVRCFPHVTNIATKTGLKYLTKIPENDQEIRESALLDEFWEELHADIDWGYKEVLEGDIIGAARKLVTACRASGQRREALEEIIKEGNINEWFKDAEGNPYSLDLLVLLRDVDTRWSSILYMIDRLLLQYPAVKVLLARPEHADISDYALNDLELRVLADVRIFLNVFHVAQQIVSAEKTPTLSIVIPVYEKLIVGLTSLKRHLPNLQHAISASIKKLEEYMGKARDTKMYILAMLINPQIKMNWAETHWTNSEIQKARGWINDAMLVHQKNIRIAQSTPVPVAVPLRKVGIPSSAAQAQRAGMSSMNALIAHLSSESLGEISSANSTPSESSTPSHTSGVLSDQDCLAQDQSTVQNEIQKWTSSGIITDNKELDEFDLVRYWQSMKAEFPILYRIALDVIPVQASAVPCERAFSSSKETDTNRRSGLGVDFMEVLQMYKYMVRGHRLNFTEGMLATEEECAALDIPPSSLKDMLKSGNIEGLKALIESSYN